MPIKNIVNEGSINKGKWLKQLLANEGVGVILPKQVKLHTLTS